MGRGDTTWVPLERQSRSPEPTPRVSIVVSAVQAVGLAAVILVGIFGVLNGGAWLARQPRAAVAAESPTGGDQPPRKIIGIPGRSDIPNFLVAVDRESQDAYARALIKKDEFGQRELLGAGKVLPVPAGTEVLVIGSTLTLRNVRILSGKHAGKSVWIEAEFVNQSP